ncbi:hypothetical protein SJY89_06485 [Bacillus velezensis]|uniref:hypothetical protein n=1 Tax=Bacillus TaxID=1386 RepID=UPI0006A81EA8|nr:MULTISPECIES: hypothetical protein [Bacillus]ATX84797.1 hypothetical protein CU084_17695 [Bacillus velezensis]MCZ4248011.1 hypothetical protein [Bacillus amyloliquefaciens]MDP1501266.1 hypothetical protein [Bacillus velezensis]MDP1505125.1 hypothetical protein [Bacillus velezensis]MDX7894868.1 hypothetical protein [Bacillus velezensis]
MNEYTECPECGNSSIKIRTQEAWIAEFSVKTRKCLNRRYLEPTFYQYFCKCGWLSGSNINDFEDNEGDE